jgi:putative SOS response-associated peptidase YedK
MCGRYRLSRRKQLIEEYFDASGDEDWNTRDNIAPTQRVPVIRQHPREPRRVFVLMRWGLIPYWSKDISGSARMINARSEMAAAKPAFRDLIKLRRCLVPADAFYEWKRTGTSKQPFCFEVNERELFAFADCGIVGETQAGTGSSPARFWRQPPNAVTSQAHDRMPVILKPDDYDLWLDPGMTKVTLLSDLLKPFDAGLMRYYPVSSRINQVQNDDAECSVSVVIVESAQNSLFWFPFRPPFVPCSATISGECIQRARSNSNMARVATPFAAANQLLLNVLIAEIWSVMRAAQGVAASHSAISALSII